MNALPPLQRDFQCYVYSRDSRMTDQVVSTQRASAADRLEVYADAYRLRLLEVIANDFPGLKALAGEEKFERLGRTYIESHPSPHFNVRWYAEGLGDFLRTNAAWASEPALGEMAALEWAMTLVFDAPDEPTATMETVASIPAGAWAGMVIAVSGALRSLRLHWNVAAIRKATDQQTSPPALQRLDVPQDYIVWRKNLTVYHRSLEPDEAWALSEAQRAVPFAELCDGLLAWTDPAEIAARAAGLMRRWVEDGLIREIRTTV